MLKMVPGVSLIFLFLTLITSVSQVQAQHPAINLYDKNFEEINPISGENAHLPFSTEQTCGICHDYEAITQGYHFQMGWDVIDDEYGKSIGQPWSLSNGLMGRWYPYAFRQLAKKSNQHADEIDLTIYDFVGFSSQGDIPPCGACHPGGGGLQYDRDGNRYDEELEADPELAETLDGDYYKSRWDRSGVVEADCLICHLKGYSFDNRVAQLEEGNYQWAIVAGSRLGSVYGSVVDGEVPEVVYERRLFNEDGTITLDMSWPPPDENCMYCHGNSGIRKRGFSWNDIFNQDIHAAQGVSCAACHSAGLDHQIAKGDEPYFTIAPELNGTMKNCQECHESGFIGAPVADHSLVRPSHLERISCEGCHIPKIYRTATQGVDMTSGEVDFYLKPPDAEEIGSNDEWGPAYDRRENGKIYPVNSVLSVWLGNRDEDDLIYPLFLREQKAAWENYEDQIQDDDGDGQPEINREEEIGIALRTLETTLQGNQRFGRIKPVLVKSEHSYELDTNGQVLAIPLQGTPLEGASQVGFSISHNTSATGAALGAQGCGDCHVSGTHFFQGARVIDLVGPEGEPVSQPNGMFFGCRYFAFFVNSIHQEIISPLFGPLIILVVFGIVLHYHSYGPRRITFDPYSQEVKRFSMIERGIHLFRLIAFVILSITGLIMAFNLHLWQQLLFPSSERMVDFHIWSGIVFAITTVGGILMWFRDALFASYDKEWVKKMGGYLGYKGHVPSGRFNAGQKMFYWYTAIFGVIISVTGLMLIVKDWFQLSTVCLTSTLHNLMGFLIIAGVLAHAYLGTVANPGTWRVLVDGSVSRIWARHHHPNWYHSLIEKGEIEDDQEPPGDSPEIGTEKESGKEDSKPQ